MIDKKLDKYHVLKKEEKMLIAEIGNLSLK